MIGYLAARRASSPARGWAAAPARQLRPRRLLREGAPLSEGAATSAAGGECAPPARRYCMRTYWRRACASAPHVIDGVVERARADLERAEPPEEFREGGSAASIGELTHRIATAPSPQPTVASATPILPTVFTTPPNCSAISSGGAKRRASAALRLRPVTPFSSNPRAARSKTNEMLALSTTRSRSRSRRAAPGRRRGARHHHGDTPRWSRTRSPANAKDTIQNLYGYQALAWGVSGLCAPAWTAGLIGVTLGGGDDDDAGDGVGEPRARRPLLWVVGGGRGADGLRLVRRVVGSSRTR